MTTLRFTLAYDGSGFAGWAAQPGLRSVEGELSAALERLTGEPVTLTVAGRTDAGVHAWAQVASTRLEAEPPRDLDARLNALTGDDLAVLEAIDAPDSFDARADARSRTYCYRVLVRRAPDPFQRGRALHWPHRLDPTLLERCAAALPGTRDFTAFTPTQTSHVRFERDVLMAEWRAGGEEVLELWIEADSFMRRMVRVLVGTMLEVAGGRRSVEDFERLLAGAPRPEAGETAPAHGLYLASVSY
jgi:tRNA pseudouridine38-40 synthase